METIIEETVRPLQRYLVDITSETHQKAVDYNLSYIDGIVLNDIAYIEDNFGKYTIGHNEFLHITEEQYFGALYNLQSLNLITITGNTATTKKVLSLKELTEDPIFGGFLAAGMAKFINETGLDVRFDPLESFKEW